MGQQGQHQRLTQQEDGAGQQSGRLCCSSIEKGEEKGFGVEGWEQATAGEGVGVKGKGRGARGKWYLPRLSIDATARVETRAKLQLWHEEGGIEEKLCAHQAAALVQDRDVHFPAELRSVMDVAAPSTNQPWTP